MDEVERLDFQLRVRRMLLFRRIFIGKDESWARNMAGAGGWGGGRNKNHALEQPDYKRDAARNVISNVNLCLFT